jgi:GTP-binding protein
VSGRGTLHLAVLIETMRREGYEMSISQPRVILKEVAGVTQEPFEQVVVNCSEEYTGAVIQKLSQRGGELVSLKVDLQKQARMDGRSVVARLIGYRSEFSHRHARQRHALPTCSATTRRRRTTAASG